jgi:hypothetical protein
MTSTCFAGDITELRVSVNGQQNGTLSTSPVRAGRLPSHQVPTTGSWLQNSPTVPGVEYTRMRHYNLKRYPANFYVNHDPPLPKIKKSI